MGGTPQENYNKKARRNSESIGGSRGSSEEKQERVNWFNERSELLGHRCYIERPSKHTDNLVPKPIIRLWYLYVPGRAGSGGGSVYRRNVNKRNLEHPKLGSGPNTGEFLRGWVWSHNNYDNMDWVIPTSYSQEEMDINYIVVQTFSERDNRTEIINFGLHIRSNTIAVEMGIEEMFKFNFWKVCEWLRMRQMPR